MHTFRNHRISATFIATLAIVGHSHAQHGVVDGQWPHYGGDLGSTKYSSLSEIDETNFTDLEIAWRWQSVDGQFDIEKLKTDYPNLQIENDVGAVTTDRMKGAPLMVDGVVYGLLRSEWRASEGGPLGP